MNPEPRTILYVGNTTRPWCTETHISASLRSLGHTVVNLQENELDWATVPRLADEHGAHMLLWTRTWPAEMSVVVPVLDQLRAVGVPSVSYHLDLFLGLDRAHQVEDQPFFRTDLLCTPHDADEWAAHGVRHLWMPPAVYDAECGTVAPNPRVWPWDVVFVGSHPYPHAEWEPTRTAVIDAFRKHFGRRFAVLPRDRGNRAIRGAALQELYATAKVVLGDSCLVGDPRGYWSDRVPETLGRGGLLIHPRVGDPLDPFIGIGGSWYDHAQHLMTYPAGDPDTALMIARDALDHPEDREIIARQGRATVLGRDTYRHRMATLIDYVAENFGWRTPPAPPPAPPVEHPRVKVQAPQGHRVTAMFDPRPGDTDVAGGSFVVVDECWTRNDYRLDAKDVKGRTVLDIGANVGAFSVLAAKLGAARVIAVEPHPENLERLHHHIALNGVGDRVTVVEAAVVGCVLDPSRIDLVGIGGGVHVLDRHEGEWEGTLYEGIPTVILNDLLSEHGVSERLAFVKIDVEGAEYGWFGNGGTEARHLDQYVDRLALEFHGPGMPHLTHLDDGRFVERWGELVATLADAGRVEIHGHPTMGGLIHWKRF